MIRYYEPIYNECCKKLKAKSKENSEKNIIKKIHKSLNDFENNISPRPKYLRILFLSFIISSIFLLLLMLFYTFSDFFHSDFSENLFLILFLINSGIMLLLAFVLNHLDKKWKAKTLTADITNHVKDCRKLHEEMKKYKIIKIGHYENFLEEIRNKKNEYIKKYERIAAFIFIDVTGFLISAATSNKLPLIILVSVLIIVYPIVFFILNRDSDKIIYYKNAECDIQTIIDDMKGYYKDIPNDSNTTN